MKGLRSAKVDGLVVPSHCWKPKLHEQHGKFHFVWEFCTWISSAVRYKMDEAENVSFLAAVALVLC